MRNRKYIAGPVFVDREMLKSEAFRSLETATSHVVLMDFLSKRQMKKIPSSKGKNKWLVSNNGAIRYTYKEAEGLGITRPAFQRAIDALLARGFIKIAHHGSGGKQGDVSLYEISDKWQEWKKGDVIFIRKKDTRKGVGFAAVHALKKASSVTST